MHVQVMLPSYLRADFDKYLGQHAAAIGVACKPAQLAEATAPHVQEVSANADGMAAAHAAEPDDSAAAVGSDRAGAGDSDSFTQDHDALEAMPTSLKPETASQDRGMTEHQVRAPVLEPDSPPAPGTAAVALDFMDADGSPPPQAAGDAAAAAAFTATGTEQPTAARQQEAAAPIIDLVFDDASGTARQAKDIDGAAFRLAGPTALLTAAQAANPASVPEEVPVLAAAAAAQSQELDHAMPGAAPLPSRSAPVLPVFRSRVSRMQLASRSALEEEAASEHSNSEMPSGVDLLRVSLLLLCWQTMLSTT